MLTTRQDLIVRELEQGTGATIGVAINHGGLRSGMQIWFDDLGPRNGPVAEMRPHGLKSHHVRLTFGDFAGGIIRQIREASAEDRQLASALVATIYPGSLVEIRGQNLDEWMVTDGSFQMDVTIRHEGRPDTDLAISLTCRDVVVPIMAAMAELIGYDVIEDQVVDDVPTYEGAIRPTLIRRRERNPRNRLLCIRRHGEICLACGLEPLKKYGETGSIIEVHHLEPLANLASPKPYDPATDLAPLCPNCHRVAHTRRPVPWSIAEIKTMLGMPYA